MIQKFFVSPKDDLSGKYIIEEKNLLTGEMTILKGHDSYSTEVEAQIAADELNKEYNKTI